MSNGSQIRDIGKSLHLQPPFPVRTCQVASNWGFVVEFSLKRKICCAISNCWFGWM